MTIVKVWLGTEYVEIPVGDIEDDSVTNAKLANMVQARVKGRASGAGTGDPTDLTGTQVGALINVGNLADTSAAGSQLNTLTDASDADALHTHTIGNLVGVGTIRQTIGYMLESDGTDIESVLQHLGYQGRNTAEQTWTTTDTYLELKTDDRKDSIYTHSTSTDPEEVTCDRAGWITFDISIRIVGTAFGTALCVLQVDTGGGFADIAGASFPMNIGRTAHSGTAVLPGFDYLNVASNKYRVRMNRLVAGDFATVIGEGRVSIRETRRT